jgi:hypothetical protein
VPAWSTAWKAYRAPHGNLRGSWRHVWPYAQVAALARSREALSERALLKMADSAARVHPGAVPLLKLRCLQAGPPASAPRGNHRTNAVAVTSPLTSTPIGRKRCSSSSSLGTARGSPCRGSSEQLALRSADERPRCRTLARNRASAPGCAAPGTGSRARAADGVRRIRGADCLRQNVGPMAAVLTPLGIVVFPGLYLAPIGITRAQEPVPVPGRGDMSNEQCSYCRKWKVECDHRKWQGLLRCTPFGTRDCDHCDAQGIRCPDA